MSTKRALRVGYPASGYFREARVLIHFTACGLEALGQTWHRGQELEVSHGSPAWPKVADWIELTPGQQAERFGEQKFAPGPVPGRRSVKSPFAAGPDGREPQVCLPGGEWRFTMLEDIGTMAPCDHEAAEDRP